MKPKSLSEAEQLVQAQSEDLDGLFFDLEGIGMPDPEDELLLIEGELPHEAELPPRPTRRSECAGTPRPCPWVMCRHHLYLDVRNDGVVRLNFPGGVETMLSTCALDLADDGPRTLDQVATLMGMSRERVRQLEERALVKLRFSIRGGDLDYEGSVLEAEDGADLMEEHRAKQARLVQMEAAVARRARVQEERAARRALREAEAAARRAVLLEDAGDVR